MTREEFNGTNFGANCLMMVLETGKYYDLVSLNFKEGLVALDDCDDIDNPSWYRCESVKIG